jgi:hypothetical protein
VGVGRGRVGGQTSSFWGKWSARASLRSCTRRNSPSVFEAV